MQAMLSWPRPKTLKALWGFLGLTGYYRKFVAGYGLIARPLTQLLRKDNFHWNQEADKAFDILREAMTHVLALALPDFSKPFIIEAYASGQRVGVVLMQGERPIAFFSQAFSERAQLKSVYEKELMAIILAVQKWQPYLLGHKFLVHTDQSSLKYILEQRLVSPNYQKWMIKLLGFDFNIQYQPGLRNRVADALSRFPFQIDTALTAITTTQWIDWGALNQDLVAEPVLHNIKESLASGQPSALGYTLVEDRLLYNNKMVIPKHSKLIPMLLKEYHDSVIGGHSGEV